jgi:phage terminase small subunit
MTTKLKPLTYRERKFVDALFLTKPPMNGTEAARVAGFSKVGASVQAVRMLRKVNIQAAIEKRKQAAETVAGVTKTQWENKVKRLFHGDVRKLFDAHNNPIDISLLGDNEALMIEGFEVVEDFTKVKNNEEGTEHAVCTGYTKKIKYTKSREALEFVGKVLGYYTEKRELTGTFTVEELVTAMEKPPHG